MIAQLLLAATLQSAPVTLICHGNATYLTTDTTTLRMGDGVDQVRGQATSSSRGRSAETAWVEIDGDTVRVRPPQAMAPALGGTGQDGWRTLTGLSMSDAEIRGRFSYSWVNNPYVRINRMTGEIDIRNGGMEPRANSFSGTCEVAPTRTTPLF